MNPTGSISAFADVSTVATWLHDLAGYRTGLFGKYLNGYGSSATTTRRRTAALHYVPPGWDRWYAHLPRRRPVRHLASSTRPASRSTPTRAPA